MTRVSIVDADSIIHIISPHYKIGSDELKALVVGEPDKETLTSLYDSMFDEEVVMARVDSFVHSILTETKADKYIGFVADPESRFDMFRYKVAVSRPYKGKRPPSADWVRYWKPKIVNHLVKEWGFYTIKGIEVDDACTIWHTTLRKDKNNFITVCSNDKDLKQVPGMHYNYKELAFEDVSQVNAWRRLFGQLFKGDSSDSIPGLPGVGPKSPLNEFPDCHNFNDYFQYTKQCYLDKGQTLEYFKEQFTLLYLLRKDDYGFNSADYSLRPYGARVSVADRIEPAEKVLPEFLC